jgi:uncharacterized protein with PQ loop repeat
MELRTFQFKPWGGLIDSEYAITLQALFLCFVVMESSYLYYQFGVIVRNKSAKDVSLVAFVMLAVANFFWVLYALFLSGNVPILVSGILTMIGALLNVGGRLYYKDGKSV